MRRIKQLLPLRAMVTTAIIGLHIAAIAIFITMNMSLTITSANQGYTIAIVQASQSHETTADTEELRNMLLELTNAERQNAGLRPVRSGNNPAPQAHAEDNVLHQYISHWDRHGLKPNHRHSLTGGVGADGENIFASNRCPDMENPSPAAKPLTTTVARALKAWMNSPGHKANILDPAHTLMHLGIAKDKCNIVLVQLFDSNYVNYSIRPNIDEQGYLSTAGTTYGATMQTPQPMKVTIGYDPPAEPLSRAQLINTHSLCVAEPAGYLTNSTNTHPKSAPHVETFKYSNACVNPYHTKAGPGPATAGQAQKAWLDAKAKSTHHPALATATMVEITPTRMSITPSRFSIAADITPVLLEHGPGIYTISLWGKPFHMKEATVISRTSIFWKTSPYRNDPDQPTSQNNTW